MKLVYVGCEERKTTNIRVREDLKKFLDTFDDVEDKELLLETKMKNTIYWDYCPYDMDINNGMTTFVWGLEEDALIEYIDMRAQDI